VCTRDHFVEVIKLKRDSASVHRPYARCAEAKNFLSSKVWEKCKECAREFIISSTLMRESVSVHRRNNTEFQAGTQGLEKSFA
jgi:hypothetical protein